MLAYRELLPRLGSVTLNQEQVPGIRPQQPATDLIGAALQGPHSHLAIGQGPALRYRPDVAAFASLGAAPDEAREAV